jgi:hypothetical protein
MHTEETDGNSAIEDMAAAAAEVGRDRIERLTDHSKTVRITSGIGGLPLQTAPVGRPDRALGDRCRATAFSTSSRRVSTPTESVSFVQTRKAIGTRGARYGRG